jgi:hypothetical protein
MDHLDANDALKISQALAAYADLKEKGTISEGDFADVKARLLAPSATTEANQERRQLLEPATSPSGKDSPTLRSVAGDPFVRAHAGDLHRMIVRALERRYPGQADDDGKAMTDMVAVLAGARALTAADVPLLHRAVTATCDLNASDLDTLHRLTEINDEARLSAETSELGRSLLAVAHDSAQNAALGRIVAPSASTAPAGSQTSFKDTVKTDLLGALGITSGIADGSAITGGFALAGVKVTTFGVWFGPTFVIWPVIVALGSGLVSGIAYALKRRKPS